MEGHPKEWQIIGSDGDAVHLVNLNLLVGKNAAGKTRTLAIIREIASLIGGNLELSEIPFPKVEYRLGFKDKAGKYDYYLKINEKSVEKESLLLNGEILLEREKDSVLILSDDSKNKENLSLNINKLAVSKNDFSNNHGISKLKEWGSSLKNGQFTNQFEKDYFVSSLNHLESKHLQDSEPSALLQIFWECKQLFGVEFTNKIKADMKALHYPIERIDILEGASGYGIYVKEDELDDLTSQVEMSQGMFRALSFIIRLNMALISETSACVLVDDMGEGLDFDRSKLLIDMLISKTYDSNIQIFITTNDRYIMNKIPLQYWSVIHRHPKESVFYNYHNSKEIFEDFKFTGLSNFDFLATDFYLKGFSDIEE